jgi:hypothetical protein
MESAKTKPWAPSESCLPDLLTPHKKEPRDRRGPRAGNHELRCERSNQASDQTMRRAEINPCVALHVSDRAVMLDLNDMSNWAESELYGYREEADLPDYRMMTGEIQGWSPYHGSWQPIVCRTLRSARNGRVGRFETQSRRLRTELSDVISIHFEDSGV